VLTDFVSLQKTLVDAGFPLVGAVDFSLAEGAYQKHADRYQQWVQNGSHGDMKYLERGIERRLNPRLVFPNLQSVVVVAKPYPSQPVGNESIRYARYLNGLDYHDVMKQELAALFETLPFQSKVCVDTSAVLERSWAALTGIGWIGKNTLLIHPQLGSYLFLAVIFTDALFGKAPQEHKDYCGPCTRCLDRCPTQAFPEPHYLEARKCVSYLTLEKRGVWETDVKTEGFVAGCDLCQEVCPYNTKATKYGATEGTADYLITDLEVLNAETELDYQARVKGTALSRIRYPDFKRNLEAAKRFEPHKK
jgi:epoxyqueuosine reductase